MILMNVIPLKKIETLIIRVIIQTIVKDNRVCYMSKSSKPRTL